MVGQIIKNVQRSLSHVPRISWAKFNQRLAYRFEALIFSSSSDTFLPTHSCEEILICAMLEITKFGTEVCVTAFFHVRRYFSRPWLGISLFIFTASWSVVLELTFSALLLEHREARQM